MRRWLRAGERALAVDRLAEGVDDPAEQAVADRHREDAAGGLDGLALLDVVAVAEHDGADRVLVEVQGQADGAVLELEQLVDADVGQAGDAGDAVADLGDAADRAGLERGLEALEVLLERRRDVGGGDGELSHVRSFSIGLYSRRLFSWSRRVRTVPSMTVSPTVATRPPSTDGSTTTFSSTCLPVALAEGGGEAVLLVVGERRRPSGPRRRPAASRRRPARRACR